MDRLRLGVSQTVGSNSTKKPEKRASLSGVFAGLDIAKSSDDSTYQSISSQTTSLSKLKDAKEEWRKQKGHLAEKEAINRDIMNKALLADIQKKKKEAPQQLEEPKENLLIHKTSVDNFSNPNMSEINSFDNVDLNFDDLKEDLQSLQKNELVSKALSAGVDLRNYSKKIDLELREIATNSVDNYISEIDNMAKLYAEVSSCDKILSAMQTFLTSFQTDLSGISSEIKVLQDESLNMNIKLRNRRAVEGKLKSFLDQVILPEKMIKVLVEGNVDDEYMKNIVLLDEKLHYCDSTSTVQEDGIDLGVPPNSTAAAKDSLLQLYNLQKVALQKSRDFLLKQFAEIRRPHTNVQMLQANVLLKYRHLMTFMYEYNSEAAKEIQNIYITSLSIKLTTVFKNYHALLKKLMLPISSKGDLIVVAESTERLEGFASSLFSKKSDKERGYAFSLGSRDSIIDEANNPPLIAHVVQAENAKLPYDCIFRSVQKHLVDIATSEYLFTQEFFQLGKSNDIFNQIFQPTIAACLDNLESYLSSSYDCIGLLIMIRITDIHQKSMEARGVPCLDRYFDSVRMVLWPRFKSIFDMNLQSLKNANPSKLGAIDLHPHYVVKRYAEFAVAISVLHSSFESNSSDEMVTRNLTQLRVEMEKLLHEMARVSSLKKKEHGVFFINNYDQILTVFSERHLPNTNKEVQHFESELNTQVGLFIEEELATQYGRLIDFVVQTEPLLDVTNPTVNEELLTSIVRDFSLTWKKGIENINGSVLKYFSNFKNGTDILKQVLTQLTMYYARFQDIIRKCYPRKPPPFSKDIVPIPTIMNEIRKFSRSFE